MSVRFLAFSDFHAHNFVEGSTRVPHPDGIPGLFNSRLIGACCELSCMREYAIRSGIKVVLFGGDLFHARGKIDVDVMNLIHHEFKKFDRDGITVIMIPGNHDYADKSGKVHSLEFLKNLEHIIVVDTPQAITADGFDVFCVPFMEDKEQIKQAIHRLSEEYLPPAPGEDRPRVLLAHCGLQGAKVGSDYVMLDAHDLTNRDIPTDKFDLCLFGHYHEYQKLFPNGYYIGATFPHNWGDANTYRGYLAFEYHSTHTFKDWEILCTPHRFTPRYLRDTVINLKLRGKKAYDLIRVEDTKANADEYAAILNANDFRNVQAIYTDSEDPAVESPTSLPIETLQPSNMVKYYAETVLKEPSAELMALGQSLLIKAAEGLE